MTRAVPKDALRAGKGGPRAKSRRGAWEQEAYSIQHGWPGQEVLRGSAERWCRRLQPVQGWLSKLAKVLGLHPQSNREP